MNLIYFWIAVIILFCIKTIICKIELDTAAKSMSRLRQKLQEILYILEQRKKESDNNERNGI